MTHNTYNAQKLDIFQIKINHTTNRFHVPTLLYICFKSSQKLINYSFTISHQFDQYTYKSKLLKLTNIVVLNGTKNMDIKLFYDNIQTLEQKK